MKRARESKLRALRLRRVRRLTAGMVHHHAPTWSSDARHIASQLGKGSDSFWVIVDRKGRVARVLEGPVVGTASFAPDGSLAYGRQVGATSEIWQLPSLSASTSGYVAPHRLLGGDGRLYRDPAYSPDGRYLCYIADDGEASAGLRLWLCDLAHDQHKLLVSELTLALHRSEGSKRSAQELRISHPAWSPTGDRIYFDAALGEKSAIYMVSLSTQQIERLTPAGYRRPAPLAAQVLLCERSGANAEENAPSKLVLIDHRNWPKNGNRPSLPDSPKSAQKSAQPELQPLELPLDGLPAHEPAVVWRRKTALVAWTMACPAARDEPSRFNLHVAQLVGLPLEPTKRAPASSATPQDGSADAGAAAAPAKGRHDAEDPAATASARSAALTSVWLDRPVLSPGVLAEIFDEEPATP
jgi:hypothetical protein